MKIEIDELYKVKGIGKKTIERIEEEFSESDNDSIDELKDIKPYIYQNGELYNDDAFNVINNFILSDKKVDAIITDPPFLHVKGGMKSDRINTGSYKPDSFVNTNMRDFDEEQIFKLLDKSKKIFRNSFNGYFFCSKLQIVSYLKWTQKNGLNYDVLIWDRQKNSLISTKFYTSNIDYVIRIYGDGQSLNKIVNDRDKGDVEYYKKIQSYPHPKNHGHETEKPIELISKYIELSTNENDVVFDPFMGSGTTGEACNKLNRKFIGVELEEKYFNISKDRIIPKSIQDQYKEKVDSMVWSFSRLNSWSGNCQYCWYQNYINRRRDSEENAFATYGSIMHEILEQSIKGELMPWELIETFENRFIEEVGNFPDNKWVDLRESYYNQGIEYLQNFDFFNNYEILEVEPKVETEISGYKFIGYIDLLVKNKNNDSIILIDHKSKAGFKTKEELRDYARQLYLYAKWVKEKYGKFPQVMQFNLFRKQDKQMIIFREKDYIEAQKWMLDTIEQIKNATEFKVSDDDFFADNLCNFRNDEGHIKGKVYTLEELWNDEV
jgi:DNA modification methylase